MRACWSSWVERWALIAALSVGAGCAAAPRPAPQVASREPFVPWGKSRLHPTLVEREPSRAPVRGGGDGTPARGPAVAGAWVFYKIYQGTWSRLDGPRCAFEPTCSRFALEAVAAYGPAGLVLAFGRLLRDHSHDGFYPETPGGRLADPVRGYVSGEGER